MERRGWLVICSQEPQVNFSRIVWTTFHWRGITSSVLVMSWPSLASLPPQVGQEHGAVTSARSRGKCAGKGARTGLGRSKLLTVVPAPAALAMAAMAPW